MKIVTVDQMQALEAASAKAGVSSDDLMEKAGLTVADRALKQLDSPRRGRVLVLVGPGNNGGDGLVAARHLHQHGARVQVYLCAPRNRSDAKLDIAVERGVPVGSVENDSHLVLLRRQLETHPLVIDAVLGTGKARRIKAPLKDILGIVDAARKEHGVSVLAVDLPTGLDAETGAVDPSCTGADITVALGHPKIGHITFPGASVTGRLEIADIGIPSGLDTAISLELITSVQVARLLPERPPDAHKGTFGRVMVVAGSRNYVGAGILACSGAYRAGAGLVTLATPKSVYPIAAAKLTEAPFLPLAETETGGIAPKAVGQVNQVLGEYACLVIGCGLGQDDGTGMFIQGVLQDDETADMPAVIDADALNYLSQTTDWHKRLKSGAVLTPHPGEMARLTGQSAADIQNRRLESARETAYEWGQVVVLKGAYTIIASPDGLTRVSPFANPGLSSGGTGDVLAGVIGGLMAQGLSPFDAATCGVYLHAAAAEELRRDMGDSGLMASDLLPEIPRRRMALKGPSAGPAHRIPWSPDRSKHD
jgi:hydroxyethylthiazole kinase-like uncharacterized protein yjeF